MTLSNVHYPFAIQLPSPEVTHFSSISVNRNLQIVNHKQGGATTPCFTGIGASNPEISFSTRQLKTVLDSVLDSGSGTKNISRDFSGDNVDLYYQAGKAMDHREDSATSVHHRARLQSSGMLFWESLSAEQGQAAEITARIVTAQRAAGDPLLWTENVTLPSRSGCGRVFTLGPVEYNGTALDGIEGITLSSNVVPEPISADGAKSNVYNGVREFHVQCDVRTSNVGLFSANAGDTYATLTIYLRRLAETDQFVADNTAEHIKIILNGGLMTTPEISGMDPARPRIMFYTKEQVNAGQPVLPMSLDTASAIT